MAPAFESNRLSWLMMVNQFTIRRNGSDSAFSHRILFFFCRVKENWWHFSMISSSLPLALVAKSNLLCNDKNMILVGAVYRISSRRFGWANNTALMKPFRRRWRRLIARLSTKLRLCCFLGTFEAFRVLQTKFCSTSNFLSLEQRWIVDRPIYYSFHITSQREFNWMDE